MEKVIVGVMVVLLIVAIAGTVVEHRRWEEFKVTHNCQVVGYMDGDVGVGLTTNGDMTTVVTSSKTGWKCDDGITYWK